MEAENAAEMKVEELNAELKSLKDSLNGKEHGYEEEKRKNEMSVGRIEREFEIEREGIGTRKRTEC